MADKERLVFPGSFLTTEEEFSSGSNSFENEDGKIYSDCIGESDFDLKNREVNVSKKTKILRMLEPGTTVIARVGLVKENNILVEIVEAKKDHEGRVIASSFATIPIFNISPGFVKKSEDMFRIGDIIKASVASVTPYCTDLTTKDREFGVIKAFCIKCRHPLRLVGNKLKCDNCGNTETRKISSDYMIK